MRMRRKRKDIEKLNLIPIMDAVFIFIFFLLMSAQFVDIFEIESTAPTVSNYDVEENKDKEEPLNLVIELTKSEIVIKTGIDSNVYKRVPASGDFYDMDLLNRSLIDLKIKNIDETTAIFKPKQNVPYKKIIKVMDGVRAINKDQPPLTGKSKKGVQKTTRKLFDNITFESIM